MHGTSGVRYFKAVAGSEQAMTVSRRGWRCGLNKAWNVSPVHPFPSAGGKTFIFGRHLVFSHLSRRVFNFVAQSTCFLRPEMPVHWIG
jgi:hypothetical protein